MSRPPHHTGGGPNYDHTRPVFWSQATPNTCFRGFGRHGGAFQKKVSLPPFSLLLSSQRKLCTACLKPIKLTPFQLPIWLHRIFIISAKNCTFAFSSQNFNSFTCFRFLQVFLKKQERFEYFSIVKWRKFAPLTKWTRKPRKHVLLLMVMNTWR